eukprot:6201900-Pleurochrysis_carterae.AAC.5
MRQDHSRKAAQASENMDIGRARSYYGGFGGLQQHANKREPNAMSSDRSKAHENKAAGDARSKAPKSTKPAEAKERPLLTRRRANAAEAKERPLLNGGASELSRATKLR